MGLTSAWRRAGVAGTHPSSLRPIVTGPGRGFEKAVRASREASPHTIVAAGWTPSCSHSVRRNQSCLALARPCVSACRLTANRVVRPATREPRRGGRPLRASAGLPVCHELPPLDALDPVVGVAPVPAGAAFARERFVLARASSIAWIWLRVNRLQRAQRCRPCRSGSGRRRSALGPRRSCRYRTSCATASTTAAGWGPAVTLGS